MSELQREYLARREQHERGERLQWLSKTDDLVRQQETGLAPSALTGSLFGPQAPKPSNGAAQKPNQATGPTIGTDPSGHAGPGKHIPGQGFVLDDPATPAAPIHEAPGGSSVIRDTQAAYRTIGATALRDVTLGALDPISGTVGVPGTSLRWQVNKPLAELQKDFGVTPSVADHWLPHATGSILGSTAPALTIFKTFNWITKGILNIGRTAPLGTAAKAGGEDFLTKAWAALVATTARTGASAGMVATLDVAHTGGLPLEQRMESAQRAALLGAAGQAAGEVILAPIFARLARVFERRELIGGPDVAANNTRSAMEAVEEAVAQMQATSGSWRTPDAMYAFAMDRLVRRFGNVTEIPRGAHVFGGGREAARPGATKPSPKTTSTATPKAEPGAPGAATADDAVRATPSPLNPSQLATIQAIRTPHPLPYGFRSPAELLRSLENRPYSIIIATNPQRPVKVDIGNRDPNEVLIQMLLSRGYDEIIPVRGKDGAAVVEALLVPGMPVEETLEISDLFGQGYGMINGGMIAVDGKQLTPATGYRILKSADDSEYNSTITDEKGNKIVFETILDFDKVATHPAFADEMATYAGEAGPTAPILGAAQPGVRTVGSKVFKDGPDLYNPVVAHGFLSKKAADGEIGINDIELLTSPKGGNAGVLLPNGNMIFRATHGEAMAAVPAQFKGQVTNKDMVLDYKTPFGRALMTVGAVEDFREAAKIGELKKAIRDAELPPTGSQMGAAPSAGPSPMNALEAASAEAKDRLSKRFKGKLFDVVGALSEGVGSSTDMAIIGGVEILRGFKKMADWKAEMKKHFGSLTDKQLKTIRTKAENWVDRQYRSKGTKDLGKKIPEIIELIDAGFASPDWYKYGWPISVKIFPRGEADAVVFWAINAGMSPQTRVDINMDSSLEVFRHWVAHGTEGLADRARSAVTVSALKHSAGVGLSDNHIDNMVEVVEELQKNPTRENFFKILEQGGAFGKYAMKVPDYAWALLGRTNTPVVDGHLGQAFSITRLTPARVELVKAWVSLDAMARNITPLGMQANYWTGNKVWLATDAAAQGLEVDAEKIKGTLAPIHEVLIKYAKQQKEAFEQQGINLNFDDLGLDDAGFAKLGFIMLMSRALIGAGIGAIEGDTIEDRIENALIGAGVAIAAPAAIKQVGRVVAQVLKRGNIAKVVNELERTGQADEFMKLFDPPSLRKPGVPSPAVVGGAQAALTAAGAPASAIFTGPQPGAPIIPSPTPPAVVRPKFEIKQLTPEQIKTFREVDPSAINIGDKMMKVNWSEIGDQTAVEDVLKRLAAMNGEAIAAARRGKISVEKTREMARKMGLSFEDVMARRQGQALNAEEAQAFIDFGGATLKRTMKLMDDLEAMPGDVSIEEEFIKQLNITKAVHEQVMGARAEAGRALNIWGTDAQGYIQLMNQLVTNANTLMPSQATIAGSAVKITPTRLAAMLKTTLGTDLKSLSTFVDKATRPGLGDAFFETMYGLFLLSNPKTLAVNVLGNAITTVFSVPERMLAAGVGTAIKGLESVGLMAPSVDHVTAREAAAMVFGMANSVDKAFQIAAHAFEYGEGSTARQKIELSPEAAITAENFALAGPVGHIVDYLGHAIRAPLRGLMATDELFKVVNGFSQVFSNGWRAAEAQGLEGDQFAKFVVNRFKDLPPEDLAQAREYADYMTFTKVLGKSGEALQQAINSLPLKYRIPLKLNLPFFTVPINIFKYAAERIPGLAFLHQSFLNDMQAGGARRDLALGRLLLGTGLLVTSAYYARQGRVTGHEAENKGERFIEKTAQHRPYSFVTSDGSQFGYDRLDPYGMIVGFGADFANIVYGNPEAGVVDKLVLGAVLPIAWNLSSKTYLEGAVRMMKAMVSGNANDIVQWFKRQSSMVVPAVAREINRSGLINDKYIRDARGAWDNIIAQTPGYSDRIPPDRDAFGHPVLIPGGWGPDVLSPIAFSKRRNEPHYKALMDAKISLTPPGDTIEGHEVPGGLTLAEPDPRQGIPLTPTQADRYKILTGQEIKFAGKNFEEAVKDMVISPRWTNQSDYMKQVMISSLHGQYKKMARFQLLAEFKDLQDLHRAKLIQREQAIRER